MCLLIAGVGRPVSSTLGHVWLEKKMREEERDKKERIKEKMREKESQS